MANSVPWYRRLATSLAPGRWASAFAPPAPKAPSRADLQQALAYVDPSRLLTAWNILPYNPSRLVTRFGLQIYDQMKRDEQVKAALKFKKDSVLAAGWEVVSPGEQPADWEVTRFVQDVFNRVPDGWHQVLINVLSALDYGYSCAEKVYAEAESGEWKGKLTLARVQSLKPHFVDFAVDDYGVLLGVVQQSVMGAGAAQGRPLPPAKFLRYTYHQEFANYYGVSDLEAAYRPFWVKDNAYKFLAVTLERYGMAPLFMLYDSNLYQAGQVEELKKVVKGIQNATLGVIPRATKEALEFWSQNLDKGSSALFLNALDHFDQHIARAILVPGMVGMSADEGKTGSLARSQTHADSFLRVVQQLQLDVATQVVNAQVIPQLCDLNWPGLEEYPLFKFLPFSDEQKLEVIKAWTALVGGQVVNKIEDDETHIRKVMGFPENENPEVLPAPAPKGAFGRGAEPGGPETAGSGEPVPAEEQSAEMRQFAEANDGVWLRAEGGGAVCVRTEA